MCRRSRGGRCRGSPASRGVIACCGCRAFLGAEWEGSEPPADELGDAFALTGFFFERNVLSPRGVAMHEARASFINAVLRLDPQAAS